MRSSIWSAVAALTAAAAAVAATAALVTMEKTSQTTDCGQNVLLRTTVARVHFQTAEGRTSPFFGQTHRPNSLVLFFRSVSQSVSSPFSIPDKVKGNGDGSIKQLKHLTQ